MARVVFAASFLEELAEVSEAAEGAIWEKVELVAAQPGVGSALLGESLRRAYGATCLKIAAGPYHVLYERNDAANEVVFLGIVVQRRER